MLALSPRPSRARPSRPLLALSLLTAVLAAAGSASAQDRLARDDAASLLRESGCVACHSLDGTASSGPTFAGLEGRERAVVRGGELLVVRADAAYLARALREPGAEIVEGYPAVMPAVVGDVDVVLRAVIAVSRDPLPPPSPIDAWPLALATASFVLLHFVLSSMAVRTRLVATMGEGKFQGSYSLIVLVAFGAIFWSWGSSPSIVLWALPAWSRWIPFAVMPIAISLMVIGTTTRNPTSAGMTNALKSEPTGLVRITRHPVLWSYALWALSHLPPNGELRTVIVMSGIALLALGGMAHIDARRAATEGEAWTRFAEKTSVVPFVAIAQGRNSLVLREIGAWRVALGLVVWAAALHLHRLAFGVSALPW